MKKRLLALLLSLTMIAGLLPAMAMAASEAEPQTIASDDAPAAVAEIEGNPLGRIPQGGTYVWQRVTGTTLDDGDYIIVNKSGNYRKVLYHEENTAKVDQFDAIINGDLASFSSSWAQTRQYWKLTRTADNTFTVQSPADNRFLNIKGQTEPTGDRIPVTTTSQGLTIVSSGDGLFTISADVDGTKYYAYRPPNNSSTHFSVNTTSADFEFYKYTFLPITLAKAEFSGTSDEPMDKADIGTTYDRIPGITTLSNGWLVATSDVRWGSSADNPQNIDTIVSVSKDNGQNWDWEIINYASDYAAGVGNTKSASFIDPAVVATKNDTIWVGADVTPFMWATGTVLNMRNDSLSSSGTGYDEQGRMMVAYSENSGLDYATPTDPDDFGYRFDLTVKSGTTAKDAWNNVRTVYPITTTNGGSDTTCTGMYVDAFFNLYETDDEDRIVPVYCLQVDSACYTQNNLLYHQSNWRIFPTFYLCLRKGTISGDHIEWADPIYPNVRYQNENQYFLAFCPGRGFTFDYKKPSGETVERIIFPLYDNGTGTEWASAMYSDDQGTTWTRSARASNGNGSGTGKSSESQIVLMPDGQTLRMYSRGNSRTICYTESEDGGKTWSGYQADNDLTYCGDCMVSFINLKGILTNKDTGDTYKYVYLASYPLGSNRTNGRLRVGYAKEGDKTIQWLEPFVLDNHNTSASFVYSCVTQYLTLDSSHGLTDEIGWLHEENGHNLIHYLDFSLNEYLPQGWEFGAEGDLYRTIPLYEDVTYTFSTNAVLTNVDRTIASYTESKTGTENHVTFHGVKEGTVYVTDEVDGVKYRYVLTVRPAELVEVTLNVGETYQCANPHASETTINGLTPNVVSYTVGSTRRVLGDAYIRLNRGSGDYVPIESALYTAEALEDGGIALWGTTTGGQKVYLAMAANSAKADQGYPFSADPVKITVSASSNTGHTDTYGGKYFTLVDSHPSRLYFHTVETNNTHLRFNRQGSEDGGPNYQTDFIILCKDKVADSMEESQVVPGYYRVNSADQVQAGHQYIIARDVGADYYLLFPSNSSSSQASHVAKYSDTQSSEVTLYYLDVTALKEGVQDVWIGGTTHRFTVLPQEVINVTLRVGKYFDGSVPYAVKPDITVTGDADAVEVEMVERDTGASTIQQVDGASDATVRARTALFTFNQITADEGSGARYFDIVSTETGSIHLSASGSESHPLGGAGSQWEIVASETNSGDYVLKSGSSYLSFDPVALAFGRSTSEVKDQTNFQLYTRDPVNTGATVKVGNVLADYYRVTSPDQIKSGMGYLIAKPIGRDIYVLYPAESDTSSAVAKVLEPDPAHMAKDWYVRAYGVKPGVAIVTIGGNIYNVTVVPTYDSEFGVSTVEGEVGSDDTVFSSEDTKRDFETALSGSDRVTNVGSDNLNEAAVKQAETAQSDALDKAREALQTESILEPNDETTPVRVMVQSRLDTKITGFEEEGQTWTLNVDIRAYYRTLATTVFTNPDGIKVKGDDDSIDVNAVQLDGKDGKTGFLDLEVTEPIELQIELPASYAANLESKVYVEHSKDGKTWHYHEGTKSGKVVTFTSTDGLSPFRISTEASPKARIQGGAAYGSLQEAVNAAKNGDVIIVMDPEQKATVNREIMLVLKDESGNPVGDDTLTADSGSGLEKKVAQGQFDFIKSGGGIGDGGGSGGSGGGGSGGGAGGGGSTPSTPSTPQSPTFIDVKENEWYYESVDYVVQRGLMSGYGNGVFAPNDTLSRAMLAQILYNLEGNPEVTYDARFNDVSNGAWYADAVIWAAKNKIVNGYDSGGFLPDDPITREQFAAMLYRYLGGKSTSAGLSGFTDAGQVSDWAVDAMNWAVSAKIIQGRGGNTLSPQSGATRAESAAMLMRFLKLGS